MVKDKTKVKKFDRSFKKFKLKFSKVTMFVGILTGIFVCLC